jgi:hypothetical protein
MPIRRQAGNAGTVQLVYRGFESRYILKRMGPNPDAGTIYTFEKGVAVEVPSSLAEELIAMNGTATGDPAHVHKFEVVEGGED